MCPVCGTRLHENTVKRSIHLGNGDDIIEQSFEGRGGIETIASYNYDESLEYAHILLKKVNLARDYLHEILGIEDDTDSDDEDDYQEDEIDE